MHDHNDSRLLERHAKGERAAFGELYDRYYHRLYGYCHRLLQDRQAVEDVVQSSFARALESAHTLEKPELFYYWLFSIARNEVYAHLRRKRDKGTVELSDDVRDSETPLDRYVRQEARALVERGLERLKPEYREVLVLRHFEQLTYAEIAAVTGDTVSAVESRLFKARKALVKFLEPYQEGRSRV